MKALFRCDNTTGNYTFDTNGENIISDIAGMVPVDKETGLAAVRIEESGEYRVHYHGEHGWVDLLSSPNEIDWQWRGPVVRFGPENMALAAVHTNGNNVSVAWPERQANFLVAKFNEDNKNKWSIGEYKTILQRMDVNLNLSESFPRPFYGPVTNSSIQKNDIFYGGGPNYHLVIPPGFEGDVVNTSISANANSQLSVFYIGEDAQLHEYFQQTNGSWKEMASPGSKEWPEADDESGRSAAASPPDSDEMWLYYTSQDDIAELYRDGGGVWRNAKMTSFTTAKNVDPDPNSNRNNGSSGTGRGSGTGETDTTTDSSSAASFATGVKVGIGIGVSVGLLVVATATWFLLRKRRQRTATTEIHQPPELQDTGKVELSDTAKFELSDTAKFELSDTAKYELPGDTSFQRS